VPRQYERYFADLRTSHEEYLKSFSRKSRSSLRRKVRKFEQASGGSIRWRCYRTPEEVEEFYVLARSVSARSYQERLLDAGLPDTDTFREGMMSAANDGKIRGYLIFLDGEVIAYLYCPIRDGVVQYAYLGYLLEFTDLSPGTVLLWLAMEALLKEGEHRVFDFTEGGDPSKHGQKRLFATGGVHCADIYVLRRNLSNTAIVLAHAGAEWTVERLGRLLDAVGVKRRTRSVVRWLLGAGKT
jgi:CelD/BcsL family acetyltransferase involved in cellulose biosynthesis